MFPDLCRVNDFLALRVQIHHIVIMTVADTLEPRANVFPEVRKWAQQNVQQWCVICDDFKKETQRTMLSCEPSAEDLREHREKMKVLLRMTRLLHAELTDPDFREPSLAGALSIRLRQLQDLWEIVHQPMDERDADRILAQAFPGSIPSWRSC
jgi:hypothetical protein